MTCHCNKWTTHTHTGSWAVNADSGTAQLPRTLFTTDQKKKKWKAYCTAVWHPACLNHSSTKGNVFMDVTSRLPRRLSLSGSLHERRARLIFKSCLADDRFVIGSLSQVQKNWTVWIMSKHCDSLFNPWSLQNETTYLQQYCILSSWFLLIPRRINLLWVRRGMNFRRVKRLYTCVWIWIWKNKTTHFY